MKKILLTFLVLSFASCSNTETLSALMFSTLRGRSAQEISGTQTIHFDEKPNMYVGTKLQYLFIEQITDNAFVYQNADTKLFIGLVLKDDELYITRTARDPGAINFSQLTKKWKLLNIF